MSENIEDYKKFLEEFKIAFDEHKKRCEERRRRGIHDLNIFDVCKFFIFFYYDMLKCSLQNLNFFRC